MRISQFLGLIEDQKIDPQEKALWMDFAEGAQPLYDPKLTRGYVYKHNNRSRFKSHSPHQKKDSKKWLCRSPRGLLCFVVVDGKLRETIRDIPHEDRNSDDWKIAKRPDCLVNMTL